MDIFQCYLLLLIEWRQSQFILSDVTGNTEQGRSTGISDLTQGAQKYDCKLCGDKGNYVSKCRKPQVSSVFMEYEKGTSKYLHGLQYLKSSVVKGLKIHE